MTITETIVITRANTSIDWPSPTVSADPNNPWINSTAITTSEISEDTLTKTVTKIWDSKDEFLTLHAYVAPDVPANSYFSAVTIPGITHTRIFATTE